MLNSSGSGATSGAPAAASGAAPWGYVDAVNLDGDGDVHQRLQQHLEEDLRAET